jgi:hypothetical protein
VAVVVAHMILQMRLLERLAVMGAVVKAVALLDQQ